MALDVDDLSPFRSFLLAKKSGSMSMQECINDLLDRLDATLTDRDGVTMRQKLPAPRGVMPSGFLHYELVKSPTWLAAGVIEDVRNELLLATGHRGHVALYVSEPWLKSTLQRCLNVGNEQLPNLDRVDPRILDQAIIADRESKTLWLSGVHRRTTTKPDNKVISGRDLRDALDPLSDQTFSHTAARSRVPLAGDPENVGVAPRKSTVWVGDASRWPEYAATVKCLLEIVDSTEAGPAEGPLPVLASHAPRGIEIGELGTPYDAALVPPETQDLESDEVARLATVLSQAVLSASVAEGAIHLRAKPQGGSGIGTVVALTLDTADPTNVAWTLEVVRDGPASVAEIREAVGIVLRRYPDWLKLWFDSGYTMADRAIFKEKFRDLPFNGWVWEDFDGFNIKKEKPAPLQATNIGHDDSLFCWVASRSSYPWSPNPGWLASNDGSMEIADFIHVDIEQRSVALVHVKGAGSASVGRDVSVSSYEVVAGQAVKNIRHLDQELLSNGFLESLDRRLTGAVWFEGQFVGEDGREPMKAAIQALGTDFDRKVVIVQPHVRERKLIAARESSSSRSRLRAQQLDTLLLNVRAACQAVGAELIVVGDGRA